MNNGVCISLLPIYNFICRCPANFTGLRCENLIGACSTSLCQNGGTCVVNGLNAALCICPPTWTGTLCTQRIDPCTTTNPCVNSGICIAVANGTNRTTVLCQCLAGFTGKSAFGDGHLSFIQPSRTILRAARISLSNVVLRQRTMLVACRWNRSVLLQYAMDRRCLRYVDFTMHFAAVSQQWCLRRSRPHLYLCLSAGLLRYALRIHFNPIVYIGLCEQWHLCHPWNR